MPPHHIAQACRRASRQFIAGALLALAAQGVAAAAIDAPALAAVAPDSASAQFAVPDATGLVLTFSEADSATLQGSNLFGFEGLWLGAAGNGGSYRLQLNRPVAALAISLLALTSLGDGLDESLSGFATDAPALAGFSSADGSASWDGNSVTALDEDSLAVIRFSALTGAGFSQLRFSHQQPQPLNGFVIRQIDVTPLAVPEPTLAALWALGGAMLLLWRRRRAGLPLLLAAVLSACGGGQGAAPDALVVADPQAAGLKAAAAVLPALPLATQRDAVRLADQASFGATEALVASIRQQGAEAWVAGQLAASGSSYTSGGGDLIDKPEVADFCAGRDANCWRDWFSAEPLQWDFYRNALSQPDQLRQRVAFALAQIMVISEFEVTGTYGWRRYHNLLLQSAFGNYRELLRRVTLSPMMGEYLNQVNNDKQQPNENYARELLQLFSLGTCLLNADGSLLGGQCQPTYDNATVRNYAFALTGWTYPPGGSSIFGCYPEQANCRYVGGDLVAQPALADAQPRTLLGGVAVPAGRTPAQALDRVLDSLMNHPNIAPFVARQLIQHLVKSNPEPAYVKRVAAAFASGRLVRGSRSFGSGQRGDLAATVAAVLLDTEARNSAPPLVAEKLREPVLMMTGVLRALNGRSDGEALGWWWGQELRQHVFHAPSVFNFYPPNFPIANTRLVGPAFGIFNANTAFARLNFINQLLYWDGMGAQPSVPAAAGSSVNLTAFMSDAADATRLVDRLVALATGGRMTAASKAQIVAAVSAWPVNDPNIDWRSERVRTAAYLVFASPAYQVMN